MQLELNGNEIVGYVELGGAEGFLEFGGEIPEHFYDNFRPSYFLLNLKNNEIVVNPNYEEPTVEIPETSEPSVPSKEWQAINMLALQVAQLKAEKGGA